tara:strand:+ start:131 stop:1207 length:1077 start_codon:yes stop_codon:yes gene_type:complete
MKKNHDNFLNLAFNIAEINLGKTGLNPSVGCVVVKNNSVISSGYTSLNGRPHAEFNALNTKKDFKNAVLYVTMEPCTHYGLTPPCTNLIIKKGIKSVYYSFEDIDNRTAKRAKKKLGKKKIKVFKKGLIRFNNFYQSYFSVKKFNKPLIDAKIAVSRDFFTIKKKTKQITNYFSKQRTFLIRSRYDAIISTSKTINEDNAVLNCRLNGFNNYKPDLIIVDRNLKIKKNLDIFNDLNNRKIYIATKITKNKKLKFFKKKGIKIINLSSFNTKQDFISFFQKLKKYSFNRILVESGLIFLNELIKYELISNLYLFQSSEKLGKKGSNNTSIDQVKKLKLTKKIKVNLKNDKLYKVRLNNV